MAVGREQRQRGAERLPQLAVAGAGATPVPHTNAPAITTTAYPQIMMPGRRARAPSATRAAEHSTTTPRASAAGGIAAFSDGVRVIGAGSQTVRATSATPASTARAA